MLPVTFLYGGPLRHGPVDLWQMKTNAVPPAEKSIVNPHFRPQSQVHNNPASYHHDPAQGGAAYPQPDDEPGYMGGSGGGGNPYNANPHNPHNYNNHNNSMRHPLAQDVGGDVYADGGNNGGMTSSITEQEMNQQAGGSSASTAVANGMVNAARIGVGALKYVSVVLTEAVRAARTNPRDPATLAMVAVYFASAITLLYVALWSVEEAWKHMLLVASAIVLMLLGATAVVSYQQNVPMSTFLLQMRTGLSNAWGRLRGQPSAQQDANGEYPNDGSMPAQV